jgi:hypothetical protein
MVQFDLTQFKMKNPIGLEFKGGVNFDILTASVEQEPKNKLRWSLFA